MTTGRRGHLPPDRHALHLATRPEEEPQKAGAATGAVVAAKYFRTSCAVRVPPGVTR